LKVKQPPFGTFSWLFAGKILRITYVKLDERILRDFKIGVFIGLRKSNRGMHTAFFINHEEAEVNDLGVLMNGLKSIPSQVRKAYQEILGPVSKDKKRKHRKKDAT
jgi:hypothetical protein